MTDVVFSSVTFSPSDFSNYGWNDPITVNGSSYIRILGLFAAAMSDLNRAMVTTAVASVPTPINFGTITEGTAVTVTLAQNIPYQAGSYVQIVDHANPTTNQIIVTLTSAVGAGTSMHGTVISVLPGGSGTATALDVSLSTVPGSNFFTGTGAPSGGLGSSGDIYINLSTGDLYQKVGSSWGSVLINLQIHWYNGAGAPSGGLGNNGDFYINLTNGDLYQKATGSWGSSIMNIVGPSWFNDGGIKVADFTAVATWSYLVDCTAGAINVTLPASASAKDKIRLVKFGTYPMNLLPNALKVNGSTATYPVLDEETFEITYSGATRGWV